MIKDSDEYKDYSDKVCGNKDEEANIEVEGQ